MQLAEQSKAEQAAAEPGDDDNNHDRRKLKASKRLRTANMQKQEGNELFAGQSYPQATAR